jgi:hypothetical protein
MKRSARSALVVLAPLAAVTAAACVVASLALASASCSSSTPARFTDDAAADASLDGPPDVGTADAHDGAAADAGLLGVRCPSAPCDNGGACCAVEGTSGPQLKCFAGGCPDAGFQIDCDGPEDCTTGNPLCCGSVTVGAGQAPVCPLESVSARCRSTCTTSLAQSCPATSTVRLCHAATDCTESGFANCCAYTQGTVTSTFCVDDATSQFSSSCF